MGDPRVERSDQLHHLEQGRLTHCLREASQLRSERARPRRVSCPEGWDPARRESRGSVPAERGWDRGRGRVRGSRIRPSGNARVGVAWKVDGCGRNGRLHIGSFVGEVLRSRCRRTRNAFSPEARDRRTRQDAAVVTTEHTTAPGSAAASGTAVESEAHALGALAGRALGGGDPRRGGARPRRAHAAAPRRRRWRPRPRAGRRARDRRSRRCASRDPPRPPPHSVGRPGADRPGGANGRARVRQLARGVRARVPGRGAELAEYAASALAVPLRSEERVVGSMGFPFESAGSVDADLVALAQLAARSEGRRSSAHGCTTASVRCAKGSTGSHGWRRASQESEPRPSWRRCAAKRSRPSTATSPSSGRSPRTKPCSSTRSRRTTTAHPAPVPPAATSQASRSRSRGRHRPSRRARPKARPTRTRRSRSSEAGRCFRSPSRWRATSVGCCEWSGRTTCRPTGRRPSCSRGDWPITSGCALEHAERRRAQEAGEPERSRDTAAARRHRGARGRDDTRARRCGGPRRGAHDARRRRRARCSVSSETSSS